MSHDKRTNHGNAMNAVVGIIALCITLMGGCKGHALTAAEGSQIERTK